MENSWQVKCGSTLQSSAPSMASSSSQELRNQPERDAGYYSFTHDPHDVRLKVHGTVQDPLLPNYPDLSSQKSGNVNLGNSFLALLSAPPSLLQCDFKELSNSKLKSDNNSVVLNAIGNGVPLRYSGSPSEYMSEQNLQHGADFCPSNSTRAVVGSNCRSNLVLPGLQSPGLETIAIRCTVPGSEKAKGSLSLNGEWHGAVPLNAGKLPSTQVQTSHMKSVEENSSVSNQSYNFLSECPRVFCLGTGGYLLISNTGLLGIVCSCHSLRMSVLKFCEHAGLWGVNPGDAVRMDNGETIAQWRKLYFQKFGIRVPEDQSDWGWPEGLAATSGLVKSRSTLPDNSYLAHSSEGLSTSGQLSDNVMLWNLHTNQNLDIDASQNKQKGDTQDGNNMTLKGLVGTSHSNMHPLASTLIMDSTISKSVGSGPQDGCQSISAYTNFVLKNGNLSVTRPSMQDLRTIGQKSDFTMFKDAPNSIFVGRDAACSNIELKLGQPYQASQNLKFSDRPALGPQLLDTVVNPSKLIFPEQMMHNNCRGRVELGQSLYFATGSCNPNTKREQNQLNLGNSGFEISNVNNVAILEKSRGNLAQNAVVSLTNFNLLADNSAQIKPNNNVLNCLEHAVSHTRYHEPCFAKCDSSNVLQNTGNGLERQLNVTEMSSHGLIDKGKGVKLVTDGSYFVKDSGSQIHKEFEISTSCPHFPASQGSSCDLYQCSTAPLAAPEARKLSNNHENIPSFGSILNIDNVTQRSFASAVGSGVILPSQVVTKGPPLVTSTCMLEQTPALHREENIGVSPHLLDDALRMLALRQILELTKQQHSFSSFGMNKRDGRYDGVSYLHHSLAESSAPGEQCNGPGPTSCREVSEATARARLAGVTNMNGCCDLSTMMQGMPRHTKEIAVQGQLSSEQSSMRHARSEANIAGPSEHGKCCRIPSVCSQRSCDCSTHINRFKMNLESTVGSFPFALKEQRGIGNGEASVIFGSKFAKNHIVQNNEIVSSDQGGKLNEKLPNNIVSHDSQWRDVPSKVKRVATVACRDTSAECINVTLQRKESFKENETSNISSGSSAPAVTQLSVEVNKMDYSCADAGNSGCVSNLVVDEGSGIDKCWSSDDTCGSDRSEEFLGDTCKTSYKESRSSNTAHHIMSRSLLDELKLINSLTWKKGQNQIQTGTSLQDEDNLSNKGNRCLKKGKRDCSSLVHDESNEGTNSTEFPSSASKEKLSLSSQKKTSGASLNQQNSEHRLSILSSTKKPSRKRDIYNIYNDKEGKEVCSMEIKAGASNSETPEISAGNRYKKDCTSNAFRQSIRPCMSSFNCQASSSQCKSRPIVCGKYGELYDGELVGHMSKPAKIVPLSGVLKLAKRCTVPKNDKPAFTSMRGLKKTRSDGDEGLCSGFHHLKNEKGSRSHNAAVCDKINNETSSEKMKTRRSSRYNKSVEDMSVSEIERLDKSKKDCGKEGSISHVQLKSRSKEIRKRSIYELTVDGEGPHQKTFSLSKISKCSPEVTEGTLLRTGEDRKHGSCEVAEKSQEQTCSSLLDSESFCCVCGSSNKDEINNLLECGRCLIKVHQACYGVSRVPKGHWYCRPCRTSSRNIVCVLCGYGGGAMTQALRSRTIVKSLLRVWNVETECKALSVKALETSLSRLNSSGPECEAASFPMCQPEKPEQSTLPVYKMDMPYHLDVLQNSLRASKLKVDNSITAGFFDSTIKQWVHMVCGLWTPGTRCPNVDTMSAFDVSGAPRPRADVVCSLCSRPGGSCIKCRILNCSVRFHPWCAHQKGLLQSEVEGVDNESVGFYGRCALHATYPMCESDSDPANMVAGGSAVEELTCARTEAYKGRKRDGFLHKYSQSKGKVGCHVPQEQLNAWIHINGQKSCIQGVPQLPVSDIEHDCRKEYARYKQGRGWKHLVVYKSGIHALGLYTSRFISRGEMVVEYVGEIVGQRVADKRENEYQSGRKLQYKSACYFFRIDKEHIIDATRKGGIARFVNHSCLPNCVAKVISIRNEKKVVFFAERDIFPGEEITYDYNFNHEDEGKKIPCFCNSKNCRRYLN